MLANRRTVTLHINGDRNDNRPENIRLVAADDRPKKIPPLRFYYFVQAHSNRPWHIGAPGMKTACGMERGYRTRSMKPPSHGKICHRCQVNLVVKRLTG